MKGGSQPHGYTIVEVMLFLTISGIMFIVAFGFVGSKQQKSQFRQGMFAIDSQIKTVINDVANGYYASTDNISCTGGGTGIAPSISSGPSGSKTQGTNKGCVFLGKVIQFSVQGTNNNGYNLFTVAGNQYVSNASDKVLATNFAQAKPIALPQSAGATDIKTLEWGIVVSHISDKSNPAGSGCFNGAGLSTQPAAFGFFGGFGNYGGAPSESGAQSVVVACVPASQPNDSLNQTETHISNIADSDVLASPQIVICFQGAQDQKGSLTIGGNNGQALTTSIKFGDPLC